MTQNDLKKVLKYDPETGVFTWKIRKANRIKIGDHAGRLTQCGYESIRIDGRDYLSHKLAWLYVYGEWPTLEIDHRDGLKSNNRITNLREATRIQNSRNSKTSSSNTSGFKGVHWKSKIKKWAATITFNRKKQHLGYFTSPQSASETYEARATELFREFKREIIAR